VTSLSELEDYLHSLARIFVQQPEGFPRFFEPEHVRHERLQEKPTIGGEAVNDFCQFLPEVDRVDTQVLAIAPGSVCCGLELSLLSALLRSHFL
jgi:hypothetical protein